MVNKSYSCHRNIDSGVVMATKNLVADDCAASEMKPKLTKSVRFAPDVKFRNEQEPLRLSPIRRTPSGNLFNLNVLLQQTDQLPAVVEKYMIRSLPETSSVQDPTANIIYIDSVGMRYKTGEKRREHAISHSHGSRDLRSSHAQPMSQPGNRDIPKGLMDGCKTSPEKAKCLPGQKIATGRELSSNQVASIKPTQARSNQCHGHAEHKVDIGATQTVGKASRPVTSPGSSSAPHGRKQFSKNSLISGGKDNPKTNTPKVSKYGPKLSKTHGSTGVNKNGANSKDIRHSTK